MRVGLTFNLKDPHANPADEQGAEWDSPETINAIVQALSTEHVVIPILADEEAFPKLKKERPDIVFNIAEGKLGPNREAHIPAMLEFLGIPYTGSDPLTLSICLDKAMTKKVLKFSNIPTPPFQVVQEVSQLNGFNSFPALVKPLWEGSSIGIHNASWVENKKELDTQVNRVTENYHQPAIIEQAVTGREFTVALLGNEENLTVLPIVEVRLDVLPTQARPIYSYEAKWIWDIPEKPLEIFQCPALIDNPLKLQIEKIAKDAFKALSCRDWCRIDIRLDAKGEPHVLELNPLPGILPDPKQNSCFPKAARAAGLSYTQMIFKVLESALQRYHLDSERTIHA